jgi:hypothetical protein
VLLNELYFCLYQASKIMREDEDVTAWILRVVFPVLICTELHKSTYHLMRNDPISVLLQFPRERVKCSILSSSYIFQSSCQALGNAQLLLGSKRDVTTATSFDIV